MKSIRQKLFAQIGSLMLLFTLMVYLANTFFLEKFYIDVTKKDLLKTYEIINRMSEEEYYSELLYEMSIKGRNYQEIVIEDAETGEAFMPLSAMPFVKQQNGGSHRRNQLRLPPREDFNRGIIARVNENITFTQITNRETGDGFLTLEGSLDNDNMLYISIPLTSVEQNVDILNTFVLIVGASVFIISLIGAGFMSRHFTKPIVNITEVTGRIRNLDFDKKCDVMTSDEIGHLAENINEMSTVLEENITGLARANESLKIEVAERLRIDEQRKALLNNVSHELKTPLSLVQGYSEGLKLNLNKNTDKADFYCEVINDEAKKMDMLVSQLLEINHIQFGDMQLNKEVTKAKKFLDYVVSKYADVFEENSIRFKDCYSDMDSELKIAVDALRSEQILTNLLNNAIAYCDERQEIFLKADKKEHHLRVSVINSCGRLPEEELDKLWNSFYKLDKARTRENGGYGLGLSIIKAIQDADSNAYGCYQEKGYITFWVEMDLA